MDAESGVVSKQMLALGAIAVTLVAILVVAAGGGGGAGTVSVIDAQELRELVDDGARLVDCRTAGEFERGHIPGAELVTPQEVTAAAQGWDPAEPVVIYCATGARSSVAAQQLASMGFEVYDYRAGLVAWDGDVVAGEAQAAAPQTPQTDGTVSGTPVMYEFATDS